MSAAAVPADTPADRVAAASLAVRGVVRLHPGAFGQVATYLPGRSVPGVRLRESPPAAEVHLVVAWGASLDATAEAVRTAVAPLVAGAVDVVIEDVQAPGELAVAPEPGR